MNKAEQSKLIFSGKYPLPLDTATKKSYKIIMYRSEKAHAVIDDIIIPELPENYFVIKATDLKGSNIIKILGTKIPVLADKKVNYIGEPLLIIIGLEISVLKTIHKSIEIKYNDIVQEEKEIVFYSKNIQIGSTDDAFIAPYKTLSGSIKTPNSIIQSKYLHGSFTKKEADNYIINVFSIWESQLKENIGSICNIDSQKINIVSPIITGGDEYPLLDSYRAAIFTTISANLIKKNVFYVPTPEDQFLYSSKIYGIEAKWQIAFDIDNNVLGIKLDVKLPSGAYPIFEKEKVLRIVHGITSYYKHKNITINVKSVKTNLPPCGLTKGLYLSDALFVSELLISKIIKESNQDQYKWRDQNILKKGFKNSTGAIIKKDFPLDIMLKNVVIKSDFSRKNSSINLSLLRKNKRIQHSTKRGIGISVGYNSNCYISNEKSLVVHSVTIQLNRDSKVDLRVSCRINNIELLNLWEDIIVSTLGVESQNIEIFNDDNNLTDYSGPNIENKNVTILTPLIKQCCDEIKVRRFKDPLPIKQTKTTRKKSSNIWNDELWKGDPFKSSSYAACAMEVEIDKSSLSCIIREIWLEVEVGQVLHKQTLLNTIHREIESTIKWLQDPEPKLRNGEFSTHYFYNSYKIKNYPKIHISIFETGKNKNQPKGVGSLIKNTIPGAYIQGINQAIGSNINSFPINEEMIYRELQKDEI